MTDNETKLQEQIDALKIEVIRLSTQVEAYRNAQRKVCGVALLPAKLFKRRASG